MPETPPYAEVALALPGLGTFQYAIPPGAHAAAVDGSRVSVSVRSRKMIGYIVGHSTKKAFDEIRPIDSFVDAEPILTPNFLELTRWMADYYLCSWGQAIETVMPAPFKKGRFKMKSRAPKKEKKIAADHSDEKTLSASQRAAYETIARASRENKNGTFLLHGITGSGKTEVYMHLIRDLLAEGRGAIVLVPEISLTPQAVERFEARFGGVLVVIHSRLSQAKRVEEWHRIRSGEAKVVVGARSAVFSPVQRLGVIVIDEEHDASYKQDETPRYHTRTVARKRAELEGAAVVLGSATPSLESYNAGQTGVFTTLSLPERIEKRPLPEVTLVDMRVQNSGKYERILSLPLEDATRAALAKKEQAMFFLNRRGFATYLHCHTCGYVASCENCRTTLAYHYDKASLFCHLCHFRTTPVRLCPSCGKNYLRYFGIGTQKVQAETQKLFPGARVARMDADSTARKDAHEEILTSFRRGEIDILVGTQMIAKGHDFPNVSLIGVISADTALHLADFRAAERTFGLLTQVAGRAGRGDVPGRVIIQTYVPTHYAIQTAKDHDYAAFYEKEIVFRKELGLPPYSHLVRLVLSGNLEKDVLRRAVELKMILESKIKGKPFSVWGPAPASAAKEGGKYRWNLLFKGESIESMTPILVEAFKQCRYSRSELSPDVDPQ